MPPLPLSRGSTIYKTSKSKHIYTHTNPRSSTPLPTGSGMCHRLEGDGDRFDGYDRAEFEEYIREDLTRRVFVDFEVFLEKALHVPADWKVLWGPAIDAVKADADFERHHEFYCKLCNDIGGQEKTFYAPLMAMANAILAVVTRTDFNVIPFEKRQYYYVNDPTHIKGGVMSKKGLSPDVVLLDAGRDPPYSGQLHWANILHLLEVKPYDTAICDGKSIPRLKNKGKQAGYHLCDWL